jgi:acyl-CoA thioesterase-2
VHLWEILDLSAHGTDVFVGAGPTYPWGGLYGGQIVAQALVAAGRTVEADEQVHSLRAYFIRRGDHLHPVRYEVDRIRTGRSFSTRRVVARQDGGAILNLEASFHRFEESEDIETIPLPSGLPPATELRRDSWSPTFERAFVPSQHTPDRLGGGRAAAWLRAEGGLPDDVLSHAAALAFLSDDLPTDAAVRAHPVGVEPQEVLHRVLFNASLDHTIWFHRHARADQWCLHDFSCHTFVGGRGLSLGHVHAADGSHVATVAQEVLLRDARRRPSGAPEPS